MKYSRMMAAVAAAALLAPVVPAAAQTSPSNTGRAGTDVFGNILGTIFGTNPATADQQMEADWNNGERPFAQRRDTLEAQIASSVNSGTISRAEADVLRDEYDDIVESEARYAQSGGITPEERRDLRMRYRTLVGRVGSGQTAAAGGVADAGYRPVVLPRAEFDARVQSAVANRRISQAEVPQIRNEYGTLSQLEANYRRNGLDSRERTELDERSAALELRLRGNGFGPDINSKRWQRFEPRIVAVERNGQLSRQQAAQLRTEIGDLARLDAAYGANGLSADERAYLTRRYGEIEARVGGVRYGQASPNR